jgi:uncharacterized protein (TIGR03083 family)
MRSEPDDQVIGALQEVWASTHAACLGLDEEQWGRDTDCPGWSVRDQLSHLIGIEKTLLAEPAPPPIEEPWPAHIKNEFAAVNEAWVEARRSLPGDVVLAEFDSVTGSRLDALRQLEPAAFDVVGWSPVGQVPYRDFMWVRVFDSWVHEQDIRRALGRPGGTEGPGASTTLDRVSATMGYVVGRKVAPPEGSTVVFDVVGPAGRVLALAVEGGRASTLSARPERPSVSLTMDEETYWRLGCGRITPAEAKDHVTIEGDEAVGSAIIEKMNFLF